MNGPDGGEKFRLDPARGMLLDGSAISDHFVPDIFPN